MGISCRENKKTSLKIDNNALSSNVFATTNLNVGDKIQYFKQWLHKVIPLNYTKEPYQR